MDNVQDEITIISGDEAMSFSLEPDGTLSLECVKVYFPDALGLVCDVKDDEGVTKVKALSIKNGQIKMEPNVKEYRVRYKSTKVDKVESIATTSTLKANATKKERVNLYRRIMEGNNIKPAGKDDDILERQNKISDLRKVSPSPGPAKLKLAPKYKTISVGWKHRYAEDLKYNQQKFPVGGSRSFQLDTAVKYNVDDIIQMGIREFTHETAVVLLKSSTIKLGFHNCEEITSFSLPNGTECGLFKYYKCNNLSSNRIQLYLLSTSVEMNASLSQTIVKTAVDTVQENYNSENENNTNTEVVAKIHHLPDKSLKDITNTNFDNFDQQVKYEEQPGQNTSKSDRSPCTYEPFIKVALINNSKDDVIIQPEQHTSNCDHSPCAYVPIGKAALIDDSKDELMMQNDNFKDDLIMQPQQHVSKCDDSPTLQRSHLENYL
ncbi:uncharacterized protein LOC100677886 [Nasonia vitripennis]|uniref:Uncharacterized protein n=1 Tax=Nasonia vitripennis TaxID=7425 RepID=A0A7M7IWX2_NASVI|nr:uncharacterized protein LOC100677886 [Nasonia vitripennis]XP_016844359.1 uncharacterized protein LOC100677886 [Nasonia vitripennis]